MIKPTLDETKAYASQLGLLANDGEYIHANWIGNGWTRNGKPIKNWQACMRAWKAAGYFPSQKNGHKPPVTEENYLL